MSVAERYHWEDGPCWNFDHQSVTQRTLVRLSNVQKVNIPLASTASEKRVKDLRQTSNVRPGLEFRVSRLAHRGPGHATADPTSDERVADDHPCHRRHPGGHHRAVMGDPTMDRDCPRCHRLGRLRVSRPWADDPLLGHDPQARGEATLDSGWTPTFASPGLGRAQVVIHSWPKQSRAGRCRDVETLIQRSHLTVEAGHRNSTVQAGYCSTASQKRRRQPWRPHLHVRPVWISCSKKPRRGP